MSASCKFERSLLDYDEFEILGLHNDQVCWDQLAFRLSSR
jgi:hypothetical protein